MVSECMLRKGLSVSDLRESSDMMVFMVPLLSYFFFTYCWHSGLKLLAGVLDVCPISTWLGSDS